MMKKSKLFNSLTEAILAWLVTTLLIATVLCPPTVEASPAAFVRPMSTEVVDEEVDVETRPLLTYSPHRRSIVESNGWQKYVDLLTDNPSAQERHQIRKRRSYRRSIRQFPRPPCGNDSTGMKSQVCQNCAKITRMRGAYEECCANENNAYSWCKRIFDFTNPLG